MFSSESRQRLLEFWAWFSNLPGLSLLFAVLDNRVFKPLLTTLIGIVALSRDGFEKELLVVASEPTQAKVLAALLATLFLSQIVNVLNQSTLYRDADETLSIVRELLQSFKLVIDYKIRQRGKQIGELGNKAPGLSFNSKNDNQIHRISDELKKLLGKYFTSNTTNIDIDIARLDQDTGRWDWWYRYNSRKPQIGAHDLITDSDNRSTARDAFKRGGAVFYLDKTKLPDGASYRSLRPDDRSGTIFAEYFSVECGATRLEFILCVNCHGEPLTEEGTIAEEFLREIFFPEFASRYKLEILNAVLGYVR